MADELTELEKKRKYAREWMAKDRLKHPEKHAARIKAAFLKKKAALQVDPDHPDHGKNGSYTAGCRCRKCRDARNRYAREFRARERAQDD